MTELKVLILYVCSPFTRLVVLRYSDDAVFGLCRRTSMMRGRKQVISTTDERNYTVSGKKEATLFSTTTLAFFGRFL